MADTETTAPAVSNGVAAKPVELKEATITRLPHKEGEPSHPAVECKGPTPKPGDTAAFVHANDVTYQGEVVRVSEKDKDGFAVVEFKDGIKPVLSK